MNPGWSVVRKMKPRDIYDTGKEEWIDEMEAEPFHVSHLGELFDKSNNQHWVRADVEGTMVDANNGLGTEVLWYFVSSIQGTYMFSVY